MDLFDFGNGDGPVPAHRHAMRMNMIPDCLRKQEDGDLINFMMGDGNVVLGG